MHIRVLHYHSGKCQMYFYQSLAIIKIKFTYYSTFSLFLNKTEYPLPGSGCGHTSQSLIKLNRLITLRSFAHCTAKTSVLQLQHV
jgi:hypothetical protein